MAHSCKFDWYVHNIAKWLNENGVRAYVAELDPRDGVEIDDKVNPEIDSSDGMIVAWTASGSASPRVRKEYARAVSKGIPIQLWLPRVGVDRPADWGDRELLQIDVRMWTMGPWKGRMFVPMDVDQNIRNRARDFAYRCLREANERSSKGVGG